MLRQPPIASYAMLCWVGPRLGGHTQPQHPPETATPLQSSTPPAAMPLLPSVSGHRISSARPRGELTPCLGTRHAQGALLKNTEAPSSQTLKRMRTHVERDPMGDVTARSMPLLEHLGAPCVVVICGGRLPAGSATAEPWPSGMRAWLATMSIMPPPFLASTWTRWTLPDGGGMGRLGGSRQRYGFRALSGSKVLFQAFSGSKTATVR